MFPDMYIMNFKPSKTIRKYGRVAIFQNQFGSKISHRSKRSTGILTCWLNIDGSINQDTTMKDFGVEFYFSHSFMIDGVSRKHVFACVN